MEYRTSKKQLDDLLLDPENPRLGDDFVESNPSPQQILEEMSGWAIEELIESFLSSGGFWEHEPIIVIPKDGKYVVVEGNRRVTALKILKEIKEGSNKDKRWIRVISGRDIPDALLSGVPSFEAESRDKVSSYIGFRHVTGVKPWNAREKAGFISKLIDRNPDITYQEIARMIGSKAPAVKKHHLAYRVLNMLRDDWMEYSADRAGRKFTLIYMLIDHSSVASFLGLSSSAKPSEHAKPVPENKIDDLRLFARWTIGTDQIAPLISDTREVTDFAHVLGEVKAEAYLREAKEPYFKVALALAADSKKNAIGYISIIRGYVQALLPLSSDLKGSPEMEQPLADLKRSFDALFGAFGVSTEDGK